MHTFTLLLKNHTKNKRFFRISDPVYTKANIGKMPLTKTMA